MVTYHFYLFFFQGKFKKNSSATFISEESPKLTFRTRHFEQLTMCFRLESSPRLKYKLSKVNYSPTPWGLVSHLSTCKSPRMPHVSPGWGGGGGGGFQWQVHISDNHVSITMSQHTKMMSAILDFSSSKTDWKKKGKTKGYEICWGQVFFFSFGAVHYFILSFIIAGLLHTLQKVFPSRNARLC